MGIPVFVLGETGSGKTYSLRNFNSEDVSIFNVAGKMPPFKKKLPIKNTSDYESIMACMAKSQKKAFVIDDSQYLICFESFAKAKDKGYDKYTDMALHFYNLIQFILRSLPQDVIVYFLHHTDTDGNTGKVKAKTLGKMLDNQLTVEGLFTIVLMTYTDGKKHVFLTQSDGTNTCKAPPEMFSGAEIDNDLKAVDTAIREFYGFVKENTNNDQKTE